MKTLSRVNHPKKHQRLMEEFTLKIITQIEKRYKNGVLDKLTKKDVAKFDDYVGNFATVMNKLSAEVKRKINKQFSNKVIEQQIKKILLSANKYNQSIIYKDIEDKFGVASKALIAKEGLTPKINALIIETQNWVKKLRDDGLTVFNNNSLRVAVNGGSLDKIIKELSANAGKYKNGSAFIARNQIASFNSISTKLRHQKLGIKKGIWKTAVDGRERKCHRLRNNKEFELSKGLYSSCDKKSILPATDDYNCRCTHLAVIPDKLNI